MPPPALWAWAPLTLQDRVLCTWLEAVLLPLDAGSLVPALASTCQTAR